MGATPATRQDMLVTRQETESRHLLRSRGIDSLRLWPWRPPRGPAQLKSPACR